MTIVFTLVLILLFEGTSLGCTIYNGYIDGLAEDENGRREDELAHAHGRFRRDLTTNCGPDDAAPATRANTTENLAALRSAMAERGVDAYVVPLDDEGRREWISGFTGSNGDCIVTMDLAACWTDGRYYLQASEQLDCNWQLVRGRVPSEAQWLTAVANLTNGSIVAADPKLYGASAWIKLEDDLAAGGSLVLTDLRENIVDLVWTEEDGRPERKRKSIVTHPLEFAGQKWEEKVAELRETMEKKGLNAMVVSEEDEIAWLFNLRGEGETTNKGLFHSPLFESLAVVSMDEVHLWVHTADLGSEVTSGHLRPLGCEESKVCVTVREFSDCLEDLAEWSAGLASEQEVLVTKKSAYLKGASYAVFKAIKNEHVKLQDSLVLGPKALKNEVEIRGMQNAHIRDAFALCELAALLQREIMNLGHVDDWTEISAAAKLAELRAAQNLSRGDSFTTISASGSNAAVIHYAPVKKTDAKINDSAIYLLDSGGQYLDGTTDVTRTFFYGTAPDPEIIEMYTRVLMGAIDLARAVVPAKTQSGFLDLNTRQPLYSRALDYRHGTGHGIGAYLKVHEGPILVRMTPESGKLQAGMFFSDEPGFYKDGEFGIRLETILRVVKKEFPDKKFGEFVGFEPVTLVPFEPALIDFSLMSPEQIEWYNDYNSRIVREISPHFSDLGRSDVLDWISEKTAHVDPGVSGSVQKWRREL